MKSTSIRTVHYVGYSGTVLFPRAVLHSPQWKGNMDTGPVLKFPKQTLSYTWISTVVFP